LRFCLSPGWRLPSAFACQHQRRLGCWHRARRLRNRPFPSVPEPTAANPRTYALTIGLRPRGASGLRRDHARRAGSHVGICDTAAIVGRESCDRAALGTCRRRASRGCLCPTAVVVASRDRAEIVTAPHHMQHCGRRRRHCRSRACSRRGSG
jgi:hypothetical protein